MFCVIAVLKNFIGWTMKPLRWKIFNKVAVCYCWCFSVNFSKNLFWQDNSVLLLLLLILLFFKYENENNWNKLRSNFQPESYTNKISGLQALTTLHVLWKPNFVQTLPLNSPIICQARHASDMFQNCENNFDLNCEKNHGKIYNTDCLA